MSRLTGTSGTSTCCRSPVQHRPSDGVVQAVAPADTRRTRQWAARGSGCGSRLTGQAHRHHSNRRIELRPEHDGSTTIVSMEPVDFPVGTRVEFCPGTELPVDSDPLCWARIAIKFDAAVCRANSLRRTDDPLGTEAPGRNTKRDRRLSLSRSRSNPIPTTKESMES